MPSSHLILCRPHFLLPSIFPSIRYFNNESSVHIRWPNTRASASASVLPVNTQGWLPLRLTGLISLLSRGLSGVFSSTTVWRHQFFGILPSFIVQLSQLYMTTGKTTALTIWTFVRRVMSLLFNTLSRFVFAFWSRSNCLLISRLQVTVCSDFGVTTWPQTSRLFIQEKPI